MGKRISVYVLILIVSIFIPMLSTNEHIINIKEYGAAGDGISDDTDAIQKALQNGANYKIYFPSGEYKISKELHISDDTEIFGNQASIKASSDLLTVFQVDGNDISIRNLTIDGNHTALRGITIAEGSNEIAITNSNIKNFTQPEDPELSRLTVSAIRIEGGTKNIIINHSKIQNVMAKNPVKGWGHLIARGILISPTHEEQTASKNIKVSNSTFSKIGPKDDGDGIVVQGFEEPVNVQILNNSFYYNYKRAIKIQSPGALIKGNQIYNNFNKNNFYTTYSTTRAYDMWAAISVYANHTTIEDNTISGIGNFGRIIDVANASHIKIIGNHLENGINGDYQDSSIVAITSNESNKILKDFTILDNTFVNGEYGIFTNSQITNLNVWNNEHVNVLEY
ncbi:glycosyl hydrolase family 28-related protein [Fredinandcohnia onubensis]|uniref:glycosyl hydrolase family 28-related protein n=1 Tax=Fredinandcohnia onubensis TaxID=1571209 RepID=UPI000C0BE762|nr:glycosyl hydrolase family 28-related protein [Fredinandcohnia onubensis]